VRMALFSVLRLRDPDASRGAQEFAYLLHAAWSRAPADTGLGPDGP
jgi:hypothetical protein